MTATRESSRLEAARRFAMESARLAANTRCHNVVVLDVGGISPITDFLVLATGTSPRQMKTVCDDLEEMAGEKGEKPMSRVGDDSASWTCIDFVDVVVHVFSQDARGYYDLDGMWGDAARVDWREDGDSPAAAPVGA